jgi:hypothetical protein
MQNLRLIKAVYTAENLVFAGRSLQMYNMTQQMEKKCYLRSLGLNNNVKL